MSDPSAINLNLPNIALTSDMMLGLKPSAPKSRSYRLNVSPLNKSIFSGLDQIIIELPTGRRNTWLDQSQSYLKFSVQCASTAAVVNNNSIYLDNSAYSFIQRLDVYNSSNLIETINEYGQLSNYLIDMSLTRSDKAGMSSLIGTNANLQIYSAAAATIVTPFQIPGDRSGMGLNSVAIASGISTAVPYTFCLPLLSGVVGVNASKMLPIGKLNAPIRLEFYLSANDDAIYSGTLGAGAVWQIVNVEFCACYVEIQDDSIDQNLGVPEYISTTTYRQTSTYLPAATSGEYTCLVPFRCSSLTALYARFRNYSNSVQGVNGTAAYRKSSSINPNFSQFYFRIGSSIYPNKPINLINGSLVGTGSEAMAELLKSFHSLSSTIGNSSITSQNYNVAATAVQGWNLANVPGAKTSGTVDTHYNAFSIGLECESFSNRSDTILSGISTLNSQIFFTGVVNSGATVGGASNFNYTVDFFSQMDMILVLENGLFTAKF